MGSLLARMGLEYICWNWRSVPKNPGIRKSKRDQSSSTLFYAAAAAAAAMGDET